MGDRIRTIIVILCFAVCAVGAYICAVRGTMNADAPEYTSEEAKRFKQERDQAIYRMMQLEDELNEINGNQSE